MELIYLCVCVCVVLFCACIGNESDETCVCWESERELDQITKKKEKETWHRINSNPHKRGQNRSKRAAVEAKQAAGMFR